MASRADLKTVISADMTGFSATMRKAGMLAKTTGGAIGRHIGSATKAMGNLALSAGKAGVALGAAGAVVGGAAFVAGIKNAADLGGKLSDISARTGILAGDLAVMGRAFEDNGVSADKIGTIINKLQRSISDFGVGSETARRPFEKLGISFDQISKLNPAAQFQLIQKKISALKSPTDRAATAMEIFGKSGGELLTLFADSGAFTGASKFLGTQAAILNRSSGIFDSISDKLARVPDKLQGFFVGFLEPIAGKVDAVLTAFDNYDFAALGLRIAEGFKFENIAPTFIALGEFLTAVIGESIAKGLQIGAALLAAAFSVDGLKFMADSIVTVFQNAFLEVALMTTRLGVALAALLAGEIALKDIPKIVFGGTDDNKEKAKSMAELIQGALDNVDWAPSDNLKKAAKNFTDTIGKLFPESSGGGGGENGGSSSKGEDYGFPGLESLYRMQRDREGGNTPGESGMLQTDKRRLGISSGIGGGAMGRWSGRQGIGDASVTGGLGEKRRLRTSADDKGAKKNLSIQEKQVEFLESIDGKIADSLKVN